VPRILAVDWGERRIGVAVSDPTGLIASGLETLEVRGEKDALEQLAALIEAEAVTRIVVGLPLLLSGEEGEAARIARAFAHRLRERTSLPVDTYDERLTSALSERRLREVRESGRKGGPGRGRNPRSTRRTPKGDIDRGAAVALLESYLQRLRIRADRKE
jgi:putative Holliday junction resolvase